MRLGRLYVGLISSSTLRDAGVVRFEESVQETPVESEADAFGRRAALAYDCTVTAQFMQTDEETIRNLLDEPNLRLKIYISPSLTTGSTVSWDDAKSDPNGYTLYDVFAEFSGNLEFSGNESNLIVRFRKRKQFFGFSDGVFSDSIIFWDWRFQNNPLVPIAGPTATYSRSGNIFIFDRNLNWTVVPPNVPPIAAAPNGEIGLLLNDSYTNSVPNNQNPPSGGFNSVKLSGNISWYSFNLGRYAANTSNNEHRVNLGSFTPNTTNRPVLFAAIYKPTGADSNKVILMFQRTNSGPSYKFIKYLINLNTLEFSIDGTYDSTQLTPAGAYAYRLPNGYYFIACAASLPQLTDLQGVDGQLIYPNANGDFVYAGDGTTEMCLVGAHGIYYGQYFVPAPVLTTGSAVTVNNSYIQFLYQQPFEPFTTNIELVLPPNVYTGVSAFGSGAYAVLAARVAPNDSYTFFGGAVYSTYINLSGNLNITTDKTDISIGYRLSETDAWAYLDGALRANGSASVTTGSSLPPPLHFYISPGGPAPTQFFVRRIWVTRGLINPRILMSY